MPSQTVHNPAVVPPIDISGVARKLLAGTPLQTAGPVLEHWFERDLMRIARLGCSESGPEVLRSLLSGLQIRYDFDPAEAARIPATGPLVVIANHPFGLVEGPVSWAVMSGVRDDVKFLANSLLVSLPQLRELTIPVDPFGGRDAVRRNWSPMRKAVEWLRAGHALIVFPAGQVASFQWPHLCIADPQWNEKVARLIQLTHARALPLFFHGTNSPVFHAAGLIHPKLRTMLLLHELLNKQGRTIRVSIGRPIGPNRLEHAAASEITGYLRARTMVLRTRDRGRASREHPRVRTAPLAAAMDPMLLGAEIERIPRAQLLLESGDLSVYVAGAREIPCTLQEIGRLRELTFRAVGEGTGRAADLDGFDRDYQHLFVWNKERMEVVGAYRFTATGKGVVSGARPRLYTETLFRMAPAFLPAISPALELGRSFVRAEYQRSYQPLLLLWKGIGQVLVANPQYRYLFGPVSISQAYSPLSRALMVAFLETHCRNEGLAGFVRPRRTYRLQPLSDLDPRNFASMVSGVEELSEIIADLEPDHKAVPILLKQYLNLGGQILDFSVDAKFSNVLDGLVVIDLTRTGQRLLDRYLTKAGAEKFRAYHGLVS